MIPVTKPFFPPREEYGEYLNGIWSQEWLTNNGPLVQKLEKKLKEYLNVPNILYLGNGTIALQIAIKALDLKGEIITTPFSYVATTSSIVWEGSTPVFVDIDRESLNINPALIEDAITDKTSGILATHVFGNPCDIDAIQKIADKHDLKVIYDAAHCFGTTYKGKSVFNFGDISTTSFHATKLFHTVEGGAVFTKDEELMYRMNRMRNFGHAGYEKFDGVGINGKNSELHAAMGLANFKYVTQIMNRRKEQCLFYDERVSNLDVSTICIQDSASWNYSYYPVLFKSEGDVLRVLSALEEKKVFPRRYFYPCLHLLDYVSSGSMEFSESISKRILCLPLYYELSENDQSLIVQVIKKSLRKDKYSEKQSV